MMKSKQELAALIGGGLAHLRINHNAHVPEPEDMPSQRARFIIFMAYGVLMASSLARYHAGETVTLYVWKWIHIYKSAAYECQAW